MEFILFGDKGGKELQEKVAEESYDDTVGTPVTKVNLFRHHDTHPVILDIFLTKELGPEWLMWLPQTVYAEIASEFGEKNISELVKSKINAIKLLHANEAFWVFWEAFVPVCQALNNNVPSFQVLVRPNVMQCMAAIDIASMVRKEKYSLEVGGFIAASAMMDGVDFLPEPLAFAEEYLAKPKYKCLDCGSIRDVDITPVRCDVCTGRFVDEHPFNNKPAEGVDKKEGTNVEVFLEIDPTKTKSLWEKFSDDPTSEIAKEHYDEPDEASFYKLITARDYMLMRRNLLQQQMRTVL